MRGDRQRKGRKEGGERRQREDERGREALLWFRAEEPAASPRALLKCSQGEALEWGLAIQLNQASERLWCMLEFETY